ncbi:MAG: hypothetical protein KAS32_06770 [Candidatus Peribacteraceae bacterium]|nr:hypothetical protein [Candidatus Peribacteraceae bacterium]
MILLDKLSKEYKDKLVEMINRVLALDGIDSQYGAIHEEMGELHAAINQFRRGRVTREDFLEEIVDVAMMLEEFLILLKIHPAEWNSMLEKKLNVFDSKIKEREENKRDRC